MTNCPIPEFWNSDPRGNWIKWLTIDADGYVKGHSEKPVFYKGDWDSEENGGITILIEQNVAYDHPENLIWEKPDEY